MAHWTPGRTYRPAENGGWPCSRRTGHGHRGHNEIFRKKASTTEANNNELHILWQVPQYAVMGMSEVLMYVSLMDFFHAEMPYGFKSFGCASTCRPRRSTIT